MRDFCWALFAALMLFSYYMTDEIEELEKIEARLLVAVGLEICLPRTSGRSEVMERLRRAIVWLRNKLKL